MDAKARGLTEGPIFKTLLIFSLPMILGKCLQQVYNLVDTYIVGMFISKEALAAVGSSYLLILFINSIIISLCTGSGAIFAHSVGANNFKQLKKDIALSFEFILIVTLLIYALTLPNINLILSFLQVPEELLGLTLDYVEIIFLGFIFTFIYNFLAFILKALNNSKIPLIFLSISCILNIILDLYFIINLKMGVKGAAIATVISEFISSLGISIYSCFYLKEYKLSITDFKFNKQRMSYIVKSDLYASLQSTVMNFGALTIQRLINTFGTTIMISFTAVSKIDTFAFLPIGEYANAYSIFVSQNLGANNAKRIHEVKKVAYITSILFGIFLAIVCNVFAKNLITIFIDQNETAIINEGIKYVRIVSSFYFLICILNMHYSHFRGLAKPFIAFYLAIASLGTRNLIAYTLANSFGATIIYIAIPIGWLIADIVGFAFDKKILKENYY